MNGFIVLLSQASLIWDYRSVGYICNSLNRQLKLGQSVLILFFWLKFKKCINRPLGET